MVEPDARVASTLTTVGPTRPVADFLDLIEHKHGGPESREQTASLPLSIQPRAVTKARIIGRCDVGWETERGEHLADKGSSCQPAWALRSPARSAATPAAG